MSWGSGGWGNIPWGGGSAGTLDLVDALAIRENVVRVSFSNPVYFSGLLDAGDASRVEKYQVLFVPGTIGLDGEQVRPVTVVDAQLAVEDGLTNPAILDLTVDRPMTAYPALYLVTVTDVFSDDLVVSVTGSLQVQAVYKLIAAAQLDTTKQSADIANPQTLAAMLDPLPDTTDPQVLGTITYDDSGDYAFDEGVTNLKKRVIRRLVTRKNAYAHLPGYGVGVPDYQKRLATASTQAFLAADAEAQIGQEPDVAKARVTVVADRAFPNLVRFRVAIIPKSGPPTRFDVPFATR